MAYVTIAGMVSLLFVSGYGLSIVAMYTVNGLAYVWRKISD